MARTLGYGVGNTNGARDFSTKVAAGTTIMAQTRSFARFVFARVFGRMN